MKRGRRAAAPAGRRTRSRPSSPVPEAAPRSARRSTRTTRRTRSSPAPNKRHQAETSGDDDDDEDDEEEDEEETQKRSSRRSSGATVEEDGTQNDEDSSDKEEPTSAPKRQTRRNSKKDKESSEDDDKDNESKDEDESSRTSKRQKRKTKNLKGSASDEEEAKESTPTKKRQTRRRKKKESDEEVEDKEEEEDEEDPPSKRPKRGRKEDTEDERDSSTEAPSQEDDGDSAKVTELTKSSEGQLGSTGDQGKIDNGAVDRVSETSEKTAEVGNRHDVVSSESPTDNMVEGGKEKNTESPSTDTPSESAAEKDTADKSTAQTISIDDADKADTKPEATPAAEPLDFLAQLASLATRAEPTIEPIKPDLAVSASPLRGEPVPIKQVDTPLEGVPESVQQVDAPLTGEPGPDSGTAPSAEDFVNRKKDSSDGNGESVESIPTPSDKKDASSSTETPKTVNDANRDTSDNERKAPIQESAAGVKSTSESLPSGIDKNEMIETGESKEELQEPVEGANPAPAESNTTNLDKKEAADDSVPKEEPAKEGTSISKGIPLVDETKDEVNNDAETAAQESAKEAELIPPQPTAPSDDKKEKEPEPEPESEVGRVDQERPVEAVLPKKSAREENRLPEETKDPDSKVNSVVFTSKKLENGIIKGHERETPGITAPFVESETATTTSEADAESKPEGSDALPTDSPRACSSDAEAPAEKRSIPDDVNAGVAETSTEAMVQESVDTVVGEKKIDGESVMDVEKKMDAEPVISTRREDTTDELSSSAQPANEVMTATEGTTPIATSENPHLLAREDSKATIKSDTLRPDDTGLCAAVDASLPEGTPDLATEVDPPVLISDVALERQIITRGYMEQPDIATESASEEEGEPPSAPKASLAKLKIKIFLAGSMVHREKGAERMFASYWGALSRCFGIPLEISSSAKRQQHLRGTREAIKNFLTTKKLRKLHNTLILGLVNRCAVETASADEVLDYVPSQWRNRVRVVSRKTRKRKRPNEFESSIMKTFNPLAASGDEMSYADNPIDMQLSLQLGCTAPPIGNSPPFPGALVVDPYIRKVAQQQGLKVSENAIWLVMVAMREYLKSLLQNTIVNMKTIKEDSAIPDAADLLKSISPRPKEKSASTQGVNALDSHDVSPSRDLKSVTALDLSSYLLASPLTRGRGFDRLSFEQCYMSAFDPLHTTSQENYEIVKQYLTSGIDTLSTAKKRSLERAASTFSPPGANSTKAQQGIPGTQDRPTGSTETKDRGTESARPDAISAKEADTSEANLNRSAASLRGMGRGAKNLAALKARATSTASKEDEIDESQAEEKQKTTATAIEASKVVVHGASATPSTDEAVASQGGHVQAAPAINDQTTIQPTSDSSAQKNPETSFSRRGGRGFGVKNLAMMRARSITEPKSDDEGAKNDPSTKEESSTKGGDECSAQSKSEDKTDLQANANGEKDDSPTNAAADPADMPQSCDESTKPVVVGAESAKLSSTTTAEATDVPSPDKKMADEAVETASSIEAAKDAPAIIDAASSPVSAKEKLTNEEIAAETSEDGNPTLQDTEKSGDKSEETAIEATEKAEDKREETTAAAGEKVEKSEVSNDEETCPVESDASPCSKKNEDLTSKLDKPSEPKKEPHTDEKMNKNGDTPMPADTTSTDQPADTNASSRKAEHDADSNVQADDAPVNGNQEGNT